MTTIHQTRPSLRASFFAFGLNANIGASVASGDTTGTGFGDIIVGATTGTSEVSVYSGSAITTGAFRNASPEASRLDQFFAADAATTTGVQVGAADFDGDGKAEILTGLAGGGARFRVVRGNATGSNPPAVNGLEGTIPQGQGPVSVAG